MNCPRSSTTVSSALRSATVLGAAFLAVLAAGCATPDYVTRSSFVEFSPDQRAHIETVWTEPYRIQPGDLLKIDFFYHRELDQDEILVLPDGSVSLLGIDQVQAAGLTVSELDSVLTAAYAQDYLDQDLTVILREIGGRQIYVLGEVRNPGLYELPRGGVNVMGAIALAGGFDKHASKGHTVIVRVTPEGYTCQEVNLDLIRSVEASELAFVNLRAYDVVYVPRSRIGDFAYWADHVLSNVLDVTRLAVDIAILSNPDAYLRR